MASVGSVTGGMELLNIHPSASKPSLISSFWSLHVQLPNLDVSEIDLRCSSQTSLPEIVQYVLPRKKEPIRSKSMSDVCSSVVDPSLFPKDVDMVSSRNQEDSAEKQRRISFSVQEWLRRIDAPSQPPSTL